MMMMMMMTMMMMMMMTLYDLIPGENTTELIGVHVTPFR